MKRPGPAYLTATLLCCASTLSSTADATVLAAVLLIAGLVAFAVGARIYYRGRAS